MTSYSSLDHSLSNITGIEGSLMYVVILVCIIAGYHVANYHLSNRTEKAIKLDEEKEVDPPRNFTVEQLKFFNGEEDPKFDDEDKPIYLSLNGTVFDVTTGKDFYGPGGPYALFAGRECGVALAKFTFGEEHLDDIAGCSKLNAGEKDVLDDWIEKFTYYRDYPIKGRLVSQDLIPSSDRIISKEELSKNDGTSEAIPKGYAATPIYVGVKDKVFDVSFGGVAMYGKGCSYFRFAGKDVSRALAKMSFDPNDIDNPSVSDLEESKLKILDDWYKTYEEKKLYPCVGRLEK